MSSIESVLRVLHKQHFGTEIKTIEALPGSGSYRQYFRITNGVKTVLGVYNTDLQENKAYFSFTNTLRVAGVKVPEIYIISEDNKSYLVQDIGKEALWDIAQKDMRAEGQLTESTLELYKRTLSGLIDMQTKTIENLDLSFCYPRDAFDKQSMLWDLYYFKYMFLRVMRVPFDEQKLENDLQKLANQLEKVDRHYFLFRDFQSRNIMIKDEEPYFIDFQGGRKGAIYYDLASLLYDANVELNEKDRTLLANDYYQKWQKIEPLEKGQFFRMFEQFAIIRLVQALGAFGLRGAVENKTHFIECIPYALSALKEILRGEAGKHFPEIKKTIDSASSSSYINTLTSPS